MERAFEDDLPLISGDLLCSEVPYVKDRLGGLGGEEDIWSSLLGGGAAPIHDTLGTDDTPLFPELLSPGSPDNDPAVLGDLDFEGSWFDTQVNLLDFIPKQESPPTTTVEHEVHNVISIVEPASQHLTELSHEIISLPPASTKPGEPEVQLSVLDVLYNLTDSTQTPTPSYQTLEQPLTEIQPLLSPISLEDVESVLSANSPSPSLPGSIEDSGFVGDSFDSDPDYSPGPIRSKVDKKAAPYQTPVTADKKQRKKQQNKSAASRYRVKKKAESQSVEQEYEKLQTRNKELKGKVEDMSREIGYLKDLMKEVYKAKGLPLPSILSTDMFA